MASHDGVDISPAELKFKFFPNKQLLAAITINNGTESRIAFKIKTTAPRKYVVRPTTGIVDLKTHATVQVIKSAEEEFDASMEESKDKFMVQTVLLKPGQEIGPDTFNKEVMKNDMREARLRVLVEGPVAAAEAAPAVEEEDEPLNERELRTLELKNMKAAEQLAKLQAAIKDLATSKKENQQLAASLQQTQAERDEIRKTLDLVMLQQGSKAAAAARDPALKFKVSIIHIILAAIVAFLIGHYI